MQGAKPHGSAERKSAEESWLQVLLDYCCCMLAEAVDDACLQIFASEGGCAYCWLQGERCCCLLLLAVCVRCLRGIG